MFRYYTRVGKYLEVEKRLQRRYHAVDEFADGVDLASRGSLSEHDRSPEKMMLYLCVWC